MYGALTWQGSNYAYFFSETGKKCYHLMSQFYEHKSQWAVKLTEKRKIMMFVII